jgi:hypothetical protein
VRYIDRFDVADYLNCPTKYHNSRQLDGTGYVRRLMDPARTTKRFIEAYAPLALSDIKLALKLASEEYHRQISMRGLDVGSEEQYGVYLGQRAIIRAALLACAFRFPAGPHARWPGIALPLLPDVAYHASGAWWPTGADVLTLNVIRPVSTAGTQDDWRHDLSLQADMLAYRQHFPDLNALYVHELVIGRRDGEHQESPLVRGYRNRATGQPAAAREWIDHRDRKVHRLGKDWEKFYPGEEDNPAGWITDLLAGKIGPGDASAAIFPAPIPVAFDAKLAERWRDQTRTQEARVEVEGKVQYPPARNWTHCRVMGGCEYYDTCWKGRMNGYIQRENPRREGLPE